MSAITFEDLKLGRERGSKWLITVAWLVEIFASGIGFYFAFVTASGTREFLEANANNMIGDVDSNVRLAMLPFIIVGLVELTKIPLAYAAYHSRVKIWRIIFLLTLTFLCVLTTETVFTGMERSLNNQMSLIADDLTEQERLKAQISSQEEDRDQILTYDLGEIEENFNEVISNTNRELNNKLEEIENTRRSREADIQERLSVQTTLFMNSQGTQVGELENQRIQKQDSLNQLIDERNESIRAVRAKAESDRAAQRDIISAATRTIDKLNEQLTEQLDGRTFFSTGTIMEEANLKIKEEEFRRDNAQEAINDIDNDELNNIENIRSDYNSSINRIDSEIFQISDEIKKGRGSNEESFGRNQEILQSQLSEIENNSQRERERVIQQNELTIANETASYEKERSIIEQRRSILNDVENKLTSDKDLLIEIEKIINRKSEQIQVLRFAKRWGDRESFSEIQSSDIAAIMLIWFGSISFIAAVTGTVIAFASFVLKDKEAFIQKRKPRNIVTNSLRRMILSRRKFYKRRERGIFSSFLNSMIDLFASIKERLLYPVIKKEFIEKEVEKIVEVPIETVIKELVYVPFYSTESGTLDLSDEIKDITKPEDIKKKINEITGSLSNKKDKNNE